jgi:hypothetical protein
MFLGHGAGGGYASTTHRELRHQISTPPVVSRAVSQLTSASNDDLPSYAESWLTSDALWNACDRLDRNIFSAVIRRLSEWLHQLFGRRSDRNDQKEYVFAAVRHLDSIPNSQYANVRSVLKLANAITNPHDSRGSPSGGLNMDDVAPFLYAEDPTLVYEALLAIWSGSTRRSHQSSNPFRATPSGGGQLSALAASSVQQHAAGGPHWPSLEKALNAIASGNSNLAKDCVRESNAVDIPTSKRSDDDVSAPDTSETEDEYGAKRLALALRVDLHRFNANSSTSEECLERITWWLRVRLVSIAMLTRHQLGFLSRSNEGGVLTHLNEAAMKVLDFLTARATNKAGGEGLVADLLAAWAAIDDCPNAVPPRVCSSPWHVVIRRLADPDVFPPSANATFASDLDRCRLLDSAITHVMRLSGRRRQHLIALLVGVMQSNPLLAPRQIIRIVTPDDRRMPGMEERNTTALDAGLVNALLAVIRQCMWLAAGQLASPNQLETRDSDDDQSAASGSRQSNTLFAATTGQVETVPLPAVDRIELTSLSSRSLTTLCAAIEVLSSVTQVSHHATVNPAQFLLPDRALCEVFKLMLDRERTVPALFVGASAFVTAAVHHDVRDVVPGLDAIGLLDQLLSQLRPIEAPTEASSAQLKRVEDQAVYTLFTPSLLAAFAVHNCTHEKFQAAAATLPEGLLSCMALSSQTRSPLSVPQLVSTPASAPPTVPQPATPERVSRPGAPTSPSTANSQVTQTAVAIDNIAPFARDVLDLGRAVPMFTTFVQQWLSNTAERLHDDFTALLTDKEELGPNDLPQWSARVRASVVQPLVAIMAFIGGAGMSSGRGPGLEDGGNASAASAFLRDMANTPCGKALAATFNGLLSINVPVEPNRIVVSYLRAVSPADFSQIWQGFMDYAAEVQALVKDSESHDDATLSQLVSDQQLVTLQYMVQVANAVDSRGNGRRGGAEHIFSARNRFFGILLDIYFRLRIQAPHGDTPPGESNASPTGPRGARTFVIADDGSMVASGAQQGGLGMGSPRGSTIVHVPDVPRSRLAAFLRSIEESVGTDPRERDRHLTHLMTGGEPLLGTRNRFGGDQSSLHVLGPLINEVAQTLAKKPARGSAALRVAEAKLATFAKLCNATATLGSAFDEVIIHGVCRHALALLKSNTALGGGRDDTLPLETEFKIVEHAFDIVRALLQARGQQRGPTSIRTLIAKCLCEFFTCPSWEALCERPDLQLAKLVMDTFGAFVRDVRAFEVEDIAPSLALREYGRGRGLARPVRLNAQRGMQDSVAQLLQAGFSQLEASIALEENDFDIDSSLRWLEDHGHRVSRNRSTPSSAGTSPMRAPPSPPVSVGGETATRDAASMQQRVEREPVALLRDNACLWAIRLINAAQERIKKMDPAVFTRYPPQRRDDRTPQEPTPDDFNRSAGRLLFHLNSTQKLHTTLHLELLRSFDESPPQRSHLLEQLASLWTQRGVAVVRMFIARSTGFTKYLTHILNSLATTCVPAVYRRVTGDVVRVLLELGLPTLKSDTSSFVNRSACDHFMRGFCWDGVRCANPHFDRPRHQTAMHNYDAEIRNAVAEFCVGQGFDAEQDADAISKKAMPLLQFVPGVTFINDADLVKTAAASVVTLLKQLRDPTAGDDEDDVGMPHGAGGQNDERQKEHEEAISIIQKWLALLIKLFAAMPNASRDLANTVDAYELLLPLARRAKHIPLAADFIAAFFDDEESSVHSVHVEMQRLIATIVHEDKDAKQFHVSVKRTRLEENAERQDAEHKSVARTGPRTPLFSPIGPPPVHMTPFASEMDLDEPHPFDTAQGPVTANTPNNPTGEAAGRETRGKDRRSAFADVEPDTDGCVTAIDAVEFLHAMEPTRLRAPFAYAAAVEKRCRVITLDRSIEQSVAAQGESTGTSPPPIPSRTGFAPFVIVSPLKPLAPWRGTVRKLAEAVFTAVIAGAMTSSIAPASPLTEQPNAKPRDAAAILMILASLTRHAYFNAMVLKPWPAPLPADEDHPACVLLAAIAVVPTAGSAAPTRDPYQRAFATLMRNVAARLPSKAIAVLSQALSISVHKRKFRFVGKVCRALELLKAGNRGGRVLEALSSNTLAKPLLQFVSLEIDDADADSKVVLPELVAPNAKSEIAAATLAALNLLKLITTPRAHTAVLEADEANKQQIGSPNEDDSAPQFVTVVLTVGDDGNPVVIQATTEAMDPDEDDDVHNADDMPGQPQGDFGDSGNDDEGDEVIELLEDDDDDGEDDGDEDDGADVEEVEENEGEDEVEHDDHGDGDDDQMVIHDAPARLVLPPEAFDDMGGDEIPEEGDDGEDDDDDDDEERFDVDEEGGFMSEFFGGAMDDNDGWGNDQEEDDEEAAGSPTAVIRRLLDAQARGEEPDLRTQVLADRLFRSGASHDRTRREVPVPPGNMLSAVLDVARAQGHSFTLQPPPEFAPPLSAMAQRQLHLPPHHTPGRMRTPHMDVNALHAPASMPPMMHPHAFTVSDTRSPATRDTSSAATPVQQDLHPRPAVSEVDVEAQIRALFSVPLPAPLLPAPPQQQEAHQLQDSPLSQNPTAAAAQHIDPNAAGTADAQEESASSPMQRQTTLANHAPSTPLRRPPTPAVAPQQAPPAASDDDTQRPWQDAFDPEFLAELPPEIRAEILRENFHLVTLPGSDGTEINPLFLAAIPSEMQQELRDIQAELNTIQRPPEPTPPPTAEHSGEVPDEPAPAGTALRATNATPTGPRPATPAAQAQALPPAPRSQAEELRELLSSLPPDLRTDILLTTDTSQLAGAPELVEEALRLRRERAGIPEVAASVPQPAAVPGLTPSQPPPVPQLSEYARMRGFRALDAEPRSLPAPPSFGYFGRDDAGVAGMGGYPPPPQPMHFGGMADEDFGEDDDVFQHRPFPGVYHPRLAGPGQFTPEHMPPSRRRPRDSAGAPRVVPIPNPNTPVAHPPAQLPASLAAVTLDLIRVTTLSKEHSESVLQVLVQLIRDPASALTVIHALLSFCREPMSATTAAMLRLNAPSHLRHTLVPGRRLPAICAARTLRLTAKLCTKNWFACQVFLRIFDHPDANYCRSRDSPKSEPNALTTTFVPAALEDDVQPTERAALENESHPPPLPAFMEYVATIDEQAFTSVAEALSELLTKLLSSYAQQQCPDKPPEESRAPRVPPLTPAHEMQHPRHVHPVVWCDPCRIHPNYARGGAVCNVCNLSTSWLLYHCGPCTFDLCQYCAAERNDSPERAALRLKRQLLLLQQASPLVESCVNIVTRRNCPALLSESITVILQDAVAAVSNPKVADSGHFEGEAFECVTRSLIRIANTMTAAISDAVTRFRAQGHFRPPSESATPAATRNALSGHLEKLELDPAAVSHQAYSLFVIQAQRRVPQPQVLRRLWNAIGLYFNEMSAALLTLTTSRNGIMLPASATPLLVAFAKFHLLAADNPESAANLGERSETEALLGENNQIRSEVSDEALRAAKQAVAEDDESAHRSRRGSGVRGTYGRAPSWLDPSASPHDTGLFSSPPPEEPVPPRAAPAGGPHLAVAAQAAAPAAQPATAPSRAGAVDRTLVHDREPLPSSLARFVEANKVTINAMINAEPSLLSGPLKFMTRCPRHIDFEHKYKDFRRRLEGMYPRTEQVSLVLNRDRTFQETFAQFRGKPARKLAGPLHIKFRGEDGADAGGLTREWFQVLAESIINPDYGLFVNSSEGMTFQPNPFSDVNPDHLSYFRFAGRIVGLAVRHEVAIDVHFTRSLYRHLVGVEPGLIDVQSIDPDMYKSLEQLLRMDLDEVDLGLDFTITHDRFGEMKELELTPGGKHRLVTNENKKEYIRRRCQMVMTTLIREQLLAFMTGFYEIIPRHVVSVFTEHELELVISGMPDIDVEDLRVNTEYQGFTPASPQIRWFWEVVAGMTKQDKANLLQFATGASKVPPGGFGNLEGLSGKTKFGITRVDADVASLPVAHTCFNRIDLPPYPSIDVLREKLMVAITYGSKGFSLV